MVHGEEACRDNLAVQCPKCTDPAMPKGDILDESMRLKG
jgi:hypothetical protein